MRAFPFVSFGSFFAASSIVGWLSVVACSSSVMPPLETGDEPVDGAPRVVVVKGADAGTDAPVVAVDASSACTAAPDGGCNDLALCSAKIPVVGSSNSPPAPTGGTIAPGMYNLSAVTAYGIPGVPDGTSTTLWFRATFALTAPAVADAGATEAGASDAGQTAGSAGLFPMTEASESDSQSLANLSGSFYLTGSTATISFTCGGAETVNATYSTGTGTFSLFVTESGGGTLGETFVLN